MNSLKPPAAQRIRRWGAVLLSLLVARPAPTSVPGGGQWGERRLGSRASVLSKGFWETVPAGPARPTVSTKGVGHVPSGARPVLESLAPFGTVRKISWISDAAPLVVHLQDVHANEGAQRNIGRAVARLMERSPVDVLALEGAFEPLDVERFRRFADRDAVATVADRLLVEGRMSGPVHAVLTSTAPAPAVWGVDDSALHAANVDAYRRAAPLREAAGAVLARERAALAAAPAPGGLRTLDETVVRYHAGRVGLGLYLDALFSAAGDGVAAPTARSFLDLLARERRMDFPAVAEDRRRFLESLVPRLTPRENDRLLAAAVGHRDGALSHAAFYDFLEDLGRSKGADLSSRAALGEYARYVRQADAIDAAALHAELPRLEDAAYRRAATGPASRAWAGLSRRTTLYEKLAGFALTPPEWHRLRTERGAAPAGVDWSAFKAFYARADDRDRALAAAVARSARTAAARRVVLVTGGYHAAGVRAALARAGMSVIEFVPRVEAVDGPDGLAALSVFDREKTPLEKLFRGDRLFLAPAPFAREDQERARVAVPLVRELRDPSIDHTGEDRDIVELALSDSPALTVEATDVPGGAALSVHNETTGEEVRVVARLDEGGRLVDVRETPVAPGWGRVFRDWIGRGREPRARVAGAGLLLWGDARRLSRARGRLSEGRGAALSAGERRRLAREWTEESRSKGNLKELVFPSPGPARKDLTLDRALRAAVALFQAERPASRNGRPIEFWAVDPEGLDPLDRGVAVWEDSAERRVLRFRHGDLAAVQRALLMEEILPEFGLTGPSRAVDREMAAAVAEDIFSSGIHLLPDDPWNLRGAEEARFRALTPAQTDRALRAAGRLRGRLPMIFASGGALAEEYWAVRTERLRDAGPRRRPTLEGLLGWYGRARAAALRGEAVAGFVAREEVRVRFHRLSQEAGVATHLAPHGMAFGIQEGVSRLAAAFGLLFQARAVGAGGSAGTPAVVDGVSRAMIDMSGPFILYQKLPNRRDAFPVWLEGIHRRVTGAESPTANGDFFESLARVLPASGAAFARLTPDLVDSARLYLEGALSFSALQDSWAALFQTAGLPPEQSLGGQRALLVMRTLGTPVGESFDRGADDLAKILVEQTPARRLGRDGWDRLASLEGATAASVLTDLFWSPTVPDPAVSLEEGVDLLFEWVGGDSEALDPESALRDHVLGWRLTREESAAALPRLEALARNVLARMAPTPAHGEAGNNVFEDIKKGTVDPAARAARWLHALGFLVSPGRFDPLNPEEPNPDMDLRVFGNTFRMAVFSADALFTQARAVREVLRWERGERGLSSSRRARRGEDRFPWTGIPSRGQFPGMTALAAVVGAGLWALPGSASAAVALPAFVDALWPAVALLAGTVATIHGLRRAFRSARDVPRRAASALGAAVAARSTAPLDALLDELGAAPLSLDVDGSAYLRVARERRWERRRDFVEAARTLFRGQGIGTDFVSVRAALADVFAGDYPISADAPVLRVWLADAALAGRVPRNPGADVLIVALDEAADRTLRAAGHAPASGSGLVRDGALSLAAVERFAIARGYAPARFAACRLMVPMSLPVQSDGVRTELFQRAIVVLMDALRGVPLRPMDLDALDRVARAIASAA